MTTPTLTWTELGRKMKDCHSHARPGSGKQYCFYASILDNPTARLTEDQERRSALGWIWFQLPGDYLALGGQQFPLSTEMVPCDEHRAMAQPLFDADADADAERSNS